MSSGDGDLIDYPDHLARQFNRVGENYGARPAYPKQIFEILADRCGLGAGAGVLEIGAGSGQATLPILDVGAHVTAVEPGPELARRLAERTRGRDITVLVERFEDAEVEPESFDLVISATAFHWVDVTVAGPKCADALHHGGWLALWWTVYGDPDRPDPFHEALQPVLQARAPHLLRPEAGHRAYLDDQAARVEAATRGNGFGMVTKDIVRWEGRHDADATRRLFATFAAWIALPEPVRSELLAEVERLAREDFADEVRRPYVTLLYQAQRS